MSVILSVRGSVFPVAFLHGVLDSLFGVCGSIFKYTPPMKALKSLLTVVSFHLASCQIERSKSRSFYLNSTF